MLGQNPAPSRKASVDRLECPNLAVVLNLPLAIAHVAQDTVGIPAVYLYALHRFGGNDNLPIARDSLRRWRGLHGDKAMAVRRNGKDSMRRTNLNVHAFEVIARFFAGHGEACGFDGA